MIQSNSVFRFVQITWLALTRRGSLEAEVLYCAVPLALNSMSLSEMNHVHIYHGFSIAKPSYTRSNFKLIFGKISSFCGLPPVFFVSSCPSLSPSLSLFQLCAKRCKIKESKYRRSMPLLLGRKEVILSSDTHHCIHARQRIPTVWEPLISPGACQIRTSGWGVESPPRLGQERSHQVVF